MLKNNPPSAGCFRYKTGTTLLVSGLTPNVRKTDIQAAFGDFGHILRIDLEPGKAYIEFEDERDALDAVSEMNGKRINCRRVQVERTQTKEVSVNTPRHGAKGVHTVDRQGPMCSESRRSQAAHTAGCVHTVSPRHSRSRSCSSSSSRPLPKKRKGSQ